MRYLFLSVVLVVGLVACKQSVKGKNGVTYKSATDYNDYIINRQTAIMKTIVEFGKTVDINPDSAGAIVKKSVGKVDKMIEEIKGMPPYKGDSALRDAALQSFIFYKKLLKEDYPAVLAIRKKGENNVTPEDAAEYNRILENITKQEEGLDKTFKNAQQDYAEKNNMKLITNKEQKNLEKEFDKLDKE